MDEMRFERDICLVYQVKCVGLLLRSREVGREDLSFCCWEG